jgi:hypothetical protein
MNIRIRIPNNNNHNMYKYNTDNYMNTKKEVKV